MKGNVRGLVADIQRASLHDGFGIRTTVFFKGCPLFCRWCHNPECISSEQQMLHYPEKCIGCGECEKGCYSGAREICGNYYTTKELLTELLRDKAYYGDNGGVTFSGGEPLLQRDFLLEVIRLCKSNQIGCAVETSLAIYDEEVFKSLDFLMADLKIWDSKIHKEYTGCENTIIKENFKRLNKLGIPIIARTPIIPEIEQGIPQISEFLSELENVVRYELLPYHPFGLSKASALGIEMTRFTVPTKEYMKELEIYAFIR